MDAHRLAAAISKARNAFVTFRKARLLTVLRPDKYLRMALAVSHEGKTNTLGIALSAQRCPDRAAVVDDLGTLTYRELDDAINALAAGLQAMVPGHPEKVAIMCRNHRGFVQALAAADRMGSDALLLNTAFAGPALADILERERPDVILFDAEFGDTVASVRARVPAMERVMAWCEHADGPSSAAALIDTHRGRRPVRTGRVGRLILLTSGTTGSPKGARRSSGGGVNELTAVLSRIPWRSEETVVVAAPMFHAWGYGQLVLGTLMSCTLVVSRRFDPEGILDLVDRHRATGLSLVPVMIERIADLPGEVLRRYSAQSLRFVSASGSRMRADRIIEFMDRFGDVVYNNYNATEVGMIACAGPQDLRERPDTAGYPLSGVRVRILDEEDNDVAPGAVGQIFAATPSAFDGYTSGESKAFHKGFMASGDIGYLDEQGRLFVVGRDDEMIVSGGENVYPIEVEKALLSHPGVAEASVVGVDDDKFGQRLVAFVVPSQDSRVDAEGLQQHVRAHLANFKVPRQVILLSELPRTNTGKILRRNLIERATDGE